MAKPEMLMFIEETFALKAVREMLRSEMFASTALSLKLREEILAMRATRLRFSEVRFACRLVFKPVSWVVVAKPVRLMLIEETLAWRLVMLVLRDEIL